MATIDHLDTTVLGIGSVLKDRVLQVPHYQRSYAWEKEHVIELIQDLSDAIAKGAREYFLGSLVVSKQDGNARPEVVDGQQRLATITLLIVAIRDFLRDRGQDKKVQGIDNTYLYTLDFRTEERSTRLRLNELDNDLFESIVVRGISATEKSVHDGKQRLRDSHERLLEAARLARRQVKRLADMHGDTPSILVDWLEFLQDRAKVILLDVPSHANAYVIFETLNDRGLDLSTADLLKNYLFRMSADRLAEVQRRWIEMTAALDAVGGDKVLLTFIRHFWISKYGPTREKELFDEVKTKVTGATTALQLASEMSENAGLYAAIVNPSHVFWEDHASATRQHLDTLRLLRMEQHRPLLLAVLRRFDRQEVEAAMRLFVSWSVRLLIVGGGGSGPMEHAFGSSSLLVENREISTAKQLADRMASVVAPDKEFRQAFATARVSKAYLARYYLRALERQARGDSQPELVPNDDENEVNLEHILPRNPSEGWAFDGLDADREHKRLGNMVLLQCGKNAQIGNDSFEDKRDVLSKSQFQLTTEVAEHKSWGPQEIAQRQERLADLAVETWKLAL